MSNEKLTKKLQGDITKVLKDHMPEYVCGVVKDRLEEADRMENELENVKAELEETDRAYKECMKLKLKADNLVEKERALDAREALLEAEKADFERNKTVYELEQQLKAAHSVTANTMEVMRNLTRNVDFRRNIFKTEDIVQPGYTDQYGCHMGPQNTGYKANSDETITESAD